jgi:hypothetical protein
METTMFALGVLTMIMVILITVVVIGIVKVFRMSQQIKNLYSYISDTERHLNDRCREIERSADERLVRMEEHFHRAITSQIEQSNSYTDKRIDKLIDTYFAVKEAEETNKKLIKG